MESGHVIVTGASGFIGAACVREFLARDWRVTALTHRRGAERLADLREQTGLRLVSGSVTERERLLQTLDDAIRAAGGACEVLVHCAGRATDIGWDRQFRSTNYEGVRTVCHAVRQLTIGRLVHISTTDVYGVRDFAGTDEATPHANNRHNPYPKYKILAEEYIRRSLPLDRYVILRPAFVWGPGDTTVLPRAIAFLRSSSVIPHFGRWRGGNRWPLAYVGNVARVAFAAATSLAALGEAYNVVDPEPDTIDGYYRMLIELFLPEQRPKRSVTLPFRIAWPIAALSTAISTLLGRDQPLFDPSLYGLRHVSHSQEFSGAKAVKLLESCGLSFIDRMTALNEMRVWATSSAAPGTRVPANAATPPA
jgi:nucleoside-diphosphate-sugar epimerase